MLGIERLAAVVCVVALICGATNGFAQTGELVDRNMLRVCADPHNLPFSNEAGEGFENKIAQLLAGDLGLEIAYTWYPQSIGFVRNTLGAHACNVVMGTVSTGELMQSTNPYYRSSYALVQRADAKTKAHALTDPQLADLRIGAVAHSAGRHTGETGSAEERHAVRAGRRHPVREPRQGHDRGRGRWQDRRWCAVGAGRRVLGQAGVRPARGDRSERRERGGPAGLSHCHGPAPQRA